MASQPTLWGNRCDTCPVRVCGERGSDQACSHPAHHDPNSIHPDKHSPHAEDLTLPTTPRSWGVAGIDSAALSVSPNGLLDASTPVANLESSMGHRLDVAHNPALGLLHGHDQQLDRLWRGRQSYARRLEGHGLAGVISPAFSNWDQLTPLHSLMALSQTAIMADLLAERMPTIPTVIWRSTRDIDRQLQWLCAGNLRGLAIEFGRPEIGPRLPGIGHLRRRLKDLHRPRPRLYACGVSSLRRAARITEAWDGPLTIVSARPARLAAAGRRLQDDLTVRRSAADRRILLRANAATFEDAIRSVTTGTRPALTWRATDSCGPGDGSADEAGVALLTG